MPGKRAIPILLTMAVAVAACSDSGSSTRALSPASTDVDRTVPDPTVPDTSTVTTTTTSTSPPLTSTTSPSTGFTTSTTGRRTGGAGRSKLLLQYDSCGALLDAIRVRALEQVTAYGLGDYGQGVMIDGVTTKAAATTMAASAERATAGPASAGASGDAATSGTNTQEVGVDESDTVETDGRYVYSVSDGRYLRIVQIDGARLVATVAMPIENASHELLLSGTRLLVVSRTYDVIAMDVIAMDVVASDGVASDGVRPMPKVAGSAEATIMPYQQSSPLVVLTRYDVSDPSNPRQVSQDRLDGELVGARATGTTARIVMRSNAASRLAFLAPTSQASVAAALASNRAVVTNSTIADWLPTVRHGNAAASQALDCTRVGLPSDSAGVGMVWVASLDITGDGPAVGEAGVVASGDLVYSSPSTLYVATTRWNWNMPVPMSAAASDARAPVTGIVAPPAVTTQIHAFDLDGGARYRASGVVPGVVSSSYAMSEWDGVLRVATTEDANGGGTGGAVSHSSVRLLRRDGDRLIEIGSVGNLGLTEQIRGVRFLGDQGYVVTFRRTDPLYVIDLSVPTAPRLAGELKVPGYSAYLHPVGDGLLLGVGQDATDQGRATGTKVSLFDVSDPAKPRELDTELLGGYSPIENDPHAFTWWAPSAFVPTYGNEGTASTSVVDVVDRVLTTRGRLGSGSYQQGDRTIVSNGRVVRVGAQGVDVYDLATLQPLGSAAFAVA